MPPRISLPFSGAAPSQARGLKPAIPRLPGRRVRRAFTGARIETGVIYCKRMLLDAAPSQARGLKRNMMLASGEMAGAAPSQARGLKLKKLVIDGGSCTAAPSQARGLKR